MNRLAHKVFILFLLTACVSFRVCADDLALPDDKFLLPDLSQMKTIDWLHIDSQKDSSGYERSDNYNKQMLRGVVMDYLESRLASLGVPHSAMTLTGAALIFAIGQDARLNLNESKTMSLQFQDINDTDRAILYRLKYSW